MAVFNIPRAKRNEDGYMERLIGNMYKSSNLIFKKGYGICYVSPETIINSFNSIRNLYCKINLLKVHCMELFIEPEIDRSVVIMIADRFGRILYDLGFQSFICVVDEGDRYVIAVAVNSVSFQEGRLFYDNNAHYGIIYQSLCEIIPLKLRLEISDNSFFDPEKRKGNYVHGVFH